MKQWTKNIWLGTFNGFSCGPPYLQDAVPQQQLAKSTTQETTVAQNELLMALGN